MSEQTASPAVTEATAPRALTEHHVRLMALRAASLDRVWSRSPIPLTAEQAAASLEARSNNELEAFLFGSELVGLIGDDAAAAEAATKLRSAGLTAPLWIEIVPTVIRDDGQAMVGLGAKAFFPAGDGPGGSRYFAAMDFSDPNFASNKLFFYSGVRWKVRHHTGGECAQRAQRAEDYERYGIKRWGWHS